MIDSPSNGDASGPVTEIEHGPELVRVVLVPVEIPVPSDPMSREFRKAVIFGLAVIVFCVVFLFTREVQGD